jgi:hypothetical protein
MRWVATAFDRGERPPRQELLSRDLGVPGDITQKISDKLIRAELLHPGGDDGEELIPARSLDRVRLVDVLDAVRADEDGLVKRLPEVDLPEWTAMGGDMLQRTLAQWIRDESTCNPIT